MLALDLCLNEVPAVSMWVSPRTAFMCVYLLRSPLWNSFTLTSGATWNEPGWVSLGCPFHYLFERFCVCRSWHWGFSLLLLFCVPLPLRAHLIYPPISTTPESSTVSCWLTRMHQSWPMEELCPSCLLQSLCILPWPISLTPWSLLCSSHAESLCALGFSSVWGRSCLMHWPLQLWQGQLLNCEWETEGTT